MGDGKCMSKRCSRIYFVLSLAGLGTAYLLLKESMKIPGLIAKFESTAQIEKAGLAETSIRGGSNQLVSSSNTDLVPFRQLLFGDSLKTDNRSQLLNGRIWKKPKLISDVNICTGNEENRSMCNINLMNAGLLHIYTPKKRFHVNRNSALNCIPTRTSPSFKICIYPRERDIFISESLIAQGMWDSGQTNLIQTALTTFPEAIFIDIGANIGYFSLLARAMDRAVIAIEPVNENFLHLEESVASNNFSDEILLLRHAITDRRTPVVMGQNKLNQGGVPIVKEENRDVIHRNSLTSVTMDDLSHLVLANEVIIKMDIEGYECRALRTSSEFFKHVKVRYLFMEWFIMVEFRNRPDTACTTKFILDALKNMVKLGFTPYSEETGEKLDIANCWSWKTKDIFWAPQDSPKLF
ncbi:hypothetical protein CHS0354_040258 [Potamilus streckersoni]|uniref:Methyltransferase FkbM domain-containing protein n=1 Tax=Potamilus streckersoni TaxID=2493646 RepID=A0AAE0S5H4_9BIVA|nr:hypothetical protein CHS0354_040258 [Potamilus streckersoni]